MIQDALQHKVYFEIAYFLGKRGKEGLRQLKKTSFSLKVNSEGREYFELNYNEATKKSQGDDTKEMNDQPIILSQPESERCPVASFKLYLSKHTAINDFFQQPDPFFKKTTDQWYNKNPVGENTIGQFMSKISVNSGLCITYTNHCVCGTTATAMHCSGYLLHDIKFVTKHKNIESLKYYLEQPTIDDMQKYSDSLFHYTDKNKNSKPKKKEIDNKHDSDFDFEPAPPRKRKTYMMTGTSTTTSETLTNPKNTNNELIPYMANEEDSSDNLPLTQNNHQ